MPINAVQSLAASGATTGILMNQYAVPFNVGFGVYTTGSGDATVHVEHCFDVEVTAATKWFDHVDISAGTTVSASSPVDGNYAYPVAHVRMVVTELSGSPTAVFRVLQTGA